MSFKRISGFRAERFRTGRLLRPHLGVSENRGPQYSTLNKDP